MLRSIPIVLLVMLSAGCIVAAAPECRYSSDCGGENFVCSSGVCLCTPYCPSSGPCTLGDGCGGACFDCGIGSSCRSDGYCSCSNYCPSSGACYLTDECGDDCFFCDPGLYCANDGYCYN
jgi:hypothetical protein